MTEKRYGAPMVNHCEPKEIARSSILKRSRHGVAMHWFRAMNENQYEELERKALLNERSLDLEDRSEYTAPDRKKRRTALLTLDPMKQAVEAPSFLVDHASSIFYHWSDGAAQITGTQLERFAASLGWPGQPRPDFFVFHYATFQISGIKTCLSIAKVNFVAALEQYHTDSVSAVAAQLWEVLKREYYQSIRPRGQVVEVTEEEKTGRESEYVVFHRFVFTFLLVSTRSFEVRNFARTIPVNVACRALMATLGELSPYTMSFCAFLSEKGIRAVNLDQWMNFLVFSRQINFPSLENFSALDCWPCLLDDYVEWLSVHHVFAGIASTLEEE